MRALDAEVIEKPDGVGCHVVKRVDRLGAPQHEVDR